MSYLSNKTVDGCKQRGRIIEDGLCEWGYRGKNYSVENTSKREKYKKTSCTDTYYVMW